MVSLVYNCLSNLGVLEGDDHGAILKELDQLSAKLDNAQKQIYGMLKSAIPKVNITVPQLSPTAFSSAASGTDAKAAPLLADKHEAASGIDAKAALLLADEHEAHRQYRLAESGAKEEIAAVRLKAVAAEKRVEEARLEAEESAKQALAGLASSFKHYKSQALAAFASLLIAVGVAYLQLGAFVGPLIASASSVIINFLSLARSWKSKVGEIFPVVSGVFSSMKSKVMNVLHTIDEKIVAPLSKLESTIDDMIESQKPTMQHIEKFESELKAVDPQLQVPEPSDLKKPLDGCIEKIEGLVDKAKQEVPHILDDMLQSNRVSRIATDQTTFNRVAVVAPLLVMLTVNLAVAVLQVQSTAAHESTAPTTLTVATHSRNLRGAKASTSKTAPSQFQDDVMMCLHPVLIQIALSVLQLVVATLLSQGPRVCNAVNRAIRTFQTKLNNRVNSRIKEAVEKVFSKALSEVKTEADAFFPKFKDIMGKLKEAIEIAEGGANFEKVLGLDQ